MEIFRNWRRKLGKPLLFGFYGAIGCLVASLLLGELFLSLTALPPTPLRQPQAVVLLIDASGSMDYGKLEEVKTAATKFVKRQNLSIAKTTENQDQIAVIGFGTDVHITSPLTSNLRQIEKAIESVDDGGGTRIDRGLEAGRVELSNSSLQKNLLLFTDGIAESLEKTMEEAQIIKNEGINLIAIATGDADTQFLTELTGDENKVFFANSGNFDTAFQEAEKLIYSQQLVESGESGNYPLIYGTLRIGIWTALISLGVSIALIIGQNHYLHRRLLSPQEATLGLISSLCAGFVAGSIGQLIFTPLANMGFSPIIPRLIGWGILGALVGGGMAFFVPNLKLSRGLIGGLIGGLMGAIAFLLITQYSTAIIGRLVGTTILGFFLGLMIALIEQINRKYSLIVNWNEKEKTTISLGEKPIVLGCAKNAHIYLPQSQGYYPITAKIYIENNQIIMEYDTEYAQVKGMKTLKHQLNDQDKRKLGFVTLEFHHQKTE
ncbi:VWA domain-containing protein [Geminocystis sp. GBBB08]|uniref:vWA domain-containing protein n=1 Tax=Geminocystis sp. GBBB08 TaxID=2604140 RepID=UPI0027E3A0E3|nr:VWA domain-containing protein [Geminocystis sp. GBBB08]MBL1208724.1 VWA domain-containing protein [Geminocystis sp. GBBB08]